MISDRPVPAAGTPRRAARRPAGRPRCRSRLSLEATCLAAATGLILFWSTACASRDAGAPPLRVLLGGDLRSLDPQASWDDVTWAVLGNVFDGLVQFDPSLRITPRLALRWINPDEKTWRFYLDPQARFHDGQPLEAADVVYSIERLRALRGSDLQLFAAGVNSATAVDVHTVEIKSSVPGSLLSSLAFIPIMSRRSGPGEFGPDRLPVGTGPYRIVAWEPHRRIRIEAGSRRPANRIGAIEIHLSPNQLTLDTVQSSQPDLVMYMPLELLTAVEANPIRGLRSLNRHALSVFYVSFNVRPYLPRSGLPNPVGDLRVRRALALATDREALVRPDASRQARPAFQMIPAPVVGFDESVAATSPDLEMARGLLRQARAEAVRIRFLVAQGSTGRVERELLSQWSRIGVRGDHVTVTAEEQRSRINEGEFHAVVQGYACTSGDAGEILDFAFRSRDLTKGVGTGNVTGYRNLEVDRLAEANVRVGDPRKRLEMLRRALRLAAEDLPYLPLFTRAEPYLVCESLIWSPPLNDDVRFEDMSWIRSKKR